MRVAVLALLALAALPSACASFPRASASPVPAPAGATFLDGAGGVRLYTHVEGDGPRGVVFFVLGPEISSSPLYPRLRAALHEAGFATAVLHPRGAGYSDGLRGDIDDYGLFLGDYAQFLDELRGRQRPLFLFGHSVGGALALELSAHAADVDGVVLVNPAYRLVYGEGMGPSMLDYVEYGANYLCRSSALTVDMNSNPQAIAYRPDRDEGEAMQRDPLTVRYFSMRYMSAQGEVMKRCVDNARATRAPLLIVEGAHDVLVDPRGTDEIAAASTSVVRLRAPDGGHGSSAVETEVARIVEWLSERAR